MTLIKFEGFPKNFQPPLREFILHKDSGNQTKAQTAERRLYERRVLRKTGSGNGTRLVHPVFQRPFWPGHWRLFMVQKGESANGIMVDAAIPRTQNARRTDAHEVASCDVLRSHVWPPPGSVTNGGVDVGGEVLVNLDMLSKTEGHIRILTAECGQPGN